MVVLNNTTDEDTASTSTSKSPNKSHHSLVKQKSEGSLASRPAFSLSSSKTSMYDTYTSLSMKREDSESDSHQRKRVPKMSKGSRKLIGYELLPKKKLVLGANGGGGGTGSGTISAANGVGGGTSSSSSSNNSIGMVKAKQAKIANGNLDDDDDDEGYDIVYDSTKEDGAALVTSVNAQTTGVGAVNNGQSYYSDSIVSTNNGQVNGGLKLVLVLMFFEFKF